MTGAQKNLWGKKKPSNNRSAVWAPATAGGKPRKGQDARVARPLQTAQSLPSRIWRRQISSLFRGKLRDVNLWERIPLVGLVTGLRNNFRTASPMSRWLQWFFFTCSRDTVLQRYYPKWDYSQMNVYVSLKRHLHILCVAIKMKMHWFSWTVDIVASIRLQKSTKHFICHFFLAAFTC